MRPEEAIGKAVLDAAMAVHTAIGAGLLESAYETCLAYELSRRGVRFRRQVVIPIKYGDIVLDAGYRLDLLVENLVVVELKSVDKLTAVHKAQLLSYLKLGGFWLGYLLNFNVVHMKDGIQRVVYGW
ncbi:MAG: GxxExxY protein [Porticoccaceae bacterium]